MRESDAMVRRTARLGSSLVSCAVRVLLGAVLVQTRIQGPANKEQPYGESFAVYR